MIQDIEGKYTNKTWQRKNADQSFRYKTFKDKITPNLEQHTEGKHVPFAS